MPSSRVQVRWVPGGASPNKRRRLLTLLFAEPADDPAGPSLVRVPSGTPEGSGVASPLPLRRAPRAGRVDAIVITKLDRFGRSTALIAPLMAELDDLGVSLVSISERFDTSTSTGRAMRGFLAYEPFPALVVDRSWHLVTANRAVAGLLAGAAPHLLEPPVNVLRLSLHPDGLAPRILNLPEWRRHVLHRLGREAHLSGDSGLAALHRELLALPGGLDRSPPNGIAVPLRLRAGDEVLSFLSTVTTFGTAVDLTAAELTVEAFLPADETTAAALGRAA